ncbi:MULTISPECIES: nuclear transport factor 2 family protein [unclassified Streptosporangium]|uniref:nuclear transport factor 2 family protein n=1 Tax=unclassified Streptosporangium TaxID=2632669 RepID=UPI002E2E288F|nr:MULTISPECIES: nuclear transport factor 2 family protein [unclassified Streptosporangium]
MTEAVARALIDKYWTAFENNDLEGWLSCYADDATYEDYAVSFFASDKTGIRDFITQYFDGVTDGEVTLHEANVWDNGSRYLLEWTIKGNLKGSFGPTTEDNVGKIGEPFELRGIAMGHIRNGLFVANRDYYVKLR